MVKRMRRTLIVIDMQNDFIDGSLGTKEAKVIVEPVKKLIQEYKNRGDEVLYTRDTHGADYLQTNEGKHLPVEHCIKGTNGWEIADGIYAAGCEIIDKPSFGYTGWDRYEFESKAAAFETMKMCQIELIGEE